MNNAITFSRGDLKLIGLQKKDGSTFKVFWNGAYDQVINSKETDLTKAADSVVEQLMGIVL